MALDKTQRVVKYRTDSGLKEVKAGTVVQATGFDSYSGAVSFGFRVQGVSRLGFKGLRG